MAPRVGCDLERFGRPLLHVVMPRFLQDIARRVGTARLNPFECALLGLAPEWKPDLLLLFDARECAGPCVGELGL